MKPIFKYVLTCWCLFVVVGVDAQGWEWGRGESGSHNEGYYCATDAVGSVYAVGFNATGTAHFGADSISQRGAFILKYDSAGHLKWLIGTNSGGPTPLGFSADLFGNYYLFGVTNTTLSMGNYTLPYSGPMSSFYYFIAKIDSTGYVKWIKSVGTFVSQGGGIANDFQGNIYITCPFSGNATIGSYSFTNAGLTDILVAKLDSSCNVLWAASFGGLKDDSPAGIAVTPSNGIYVTGNFSSDTLSFGSTQLIDTSGPSIFLAKLNNLGNAVWAKEWHDTSGFNTAGAIATTNSGDVFIAGHSRALYSPYGFLAKVDSAGNSDWVKEMKGRFILPYSLCTDPCENIWVCSALYATDTVDGHIIEALPPTGGNDPIFIASWTSEGSFLQATRLPCGGDDYCGITSDKYGNLFVEGDYEASTFIIGNDTLTNVGPEKNFVAKYNPNLGCNYNAVKNTTKPDYNTNIYPNPTTTELIITSSEKINDIAIINVLGQVVYSQHCDAEKIVVRVGMLPAGVYFVKINGPDSYRGEVRRFVKE